MKVKILMLVLSILSASLFGCATTNGFAAIDPLDPPLPALGVTPPDPSIPANIAAFSGVWRGTITGSGGRHLGRYLMVVHEIYPTPTQSYAHRAKVFFSWRARFGHDSYDTRMVEISPDGIISVKFDHDSAKFFIVQGGYIKAHWSYTASVYSDAILSRQP